MFRTQNLCPGSKNVFDLGQKHFLLPSSKICFSAACDSRVAKLGTFVSATMFPQQCLLA